MNAPIYEFNEGQARAAEKTTPLITAAGKYVGVFTCAEAISSNYGHTVELTFKATDGREARYLKLYTYNEKGEAQRGLNMLMAIMRILGVRSPKAEKVKLERFVNGSKQMVDCTVFPELMNKPIGVLLKEREYLKKDQSIGHAMDLFQPFSVPGEMLASEILDKATSPALLAQKVIELMADPIYRVKPKGGAMRSAQPAGSDADFEDDVPF